MGRQQLRGRMTRIVEPSVATRLRIHSRESPVSRPICGWRPHWVDHMHEPDGGEDTIGCTRLGVAEFQRHMDALYSRNGVLAAWGDVDEVFLDPASVKLACAEEIAIFKKLGVYRRVPRTRVSEMNGNMVSTKWLDTNKGDRLNPNYRSRLVARELNQGKDDTLYASTPPLEAMRLIVFHAATIDPDNPGERRHLIVNDVRRAYFYARQRRNLFIELLAEDDEAEPGEVGQLMLCLYGTRDAAREWQHTLSARLASLGFVAGHGRPSIFTHRQRGVRLLVHGDDYFSSGHGADLDWLECQLKNIYEIHTQRIGAGKAGECDLKILNRIVRSTSAGYDLEADPRHAEFAILQMKLEQAKLLSTPGFDGKEEEDMEEELPLDPERARI